MRVIQSITIGEIVLWVTGALAAIGTIWAAVKKVLPFFKSLRLFLEDWNGEPARPGVAKRAGVMERLDRVEHELKPNSGSSLRDAIDRVETQGRTAVTTAETVAADLAASVIDRRIQIDAVRADLARHIQDTGGAHP